MAKKLHLNTPQRWQPTANGQLPRMFCTSMRWNYSSHQQVAVVCIRHSKKETRRPRTADIQAVVMILTWNKALFADHFHTTHHLASFQMTMSLSKYPCVGTIRWDEDIKREEPSVRVLLTLLVCLLSSLPFLFSGTDSLNSQSEWFLSPTGSAADSTCWIGRKTSDTGRLEPTVQDTQQKLGRETLTDGPKLSDGRTSAWCVRACRASCAIFWQEIQQFLLNKERHALKRVPVTVWDKYTYRIPRGWTLPDKVIQEKTINMKTSPPTLCPRNTFDSFSGCDPASSLSHSFVIHAILWQWGQTDGRTDGQTRQGVVPLQRHSGINDELSKPKGKLLWSKYTLQRGVGLARSLWWVYCVCGGSHSGTASLCMCVCVFVKMCGTPVESERNPHLLIVRAPLWNILGCVCCSGCDG